jgi:hypothetical protein
MKNIITLNESDIARIVKRVISENQKVLFNLIDYRDYNVCLSRVRKEIEESKH